MTFFEEFSEENLDRISKLFSKNFNFNSNQFQFQQE